MAAPSAENSRELRRKITFEANTPKTVTFEYGGPGIETTGQYGTQYRYSLENNEIMWVEPVVEGMLKQLDIHSGDSVVITKVKEGKTTKWRVEELAEEPAIAAQLAQSIENAKATTEARAKAELAPAAPYGQAGLHEPPDWRAQQHTNGAAKSAAPEARQITPAALNMTAALCSAIDAAIEAERYAHGRGLTLKFSPADIRALANCAEIGEQR